MPRPFRVGVYVDGFNLYYGAKGLCDVNGWKWLDIRALSERLLLQRRDPAWGKAHIVRVVYCTARVSGRDDPTSPVDQDRYLKALVAGQSVDLIEEGNYVESVISRPLASAGKHGKPVLQKPRKFVEVSTREEKASDVNVATHLLMDMMGGTISAALVVSNDSDLRLPVRIARGRISVAAINPSSRNTAGHLRGKPTDGIGGHWWYQLTRADLTACQLPNPVGRRLYRPTDW